MILHNNKGSRQCLWSELGSFEKSQTKLGSFGRSKAKVTSYFRSVRLFFISYSFLRFVPKYTGIDKIVRRYPQQISEDPMEQVDTLLQLNYVISTGESQHDQV